MQISKRIEATYPPDPVILQIFASWEENSAFKIDAAFLDSLGTFSFTAESNKFHLLLNNFKRKYIAPRAVKKRIHHWLFQRERSHRCWSYFNCWWRSCYLFLCCGLDGSRYQHIVQTILPWPRSILPYFEILKIRSPPPPQLIKKPLLLSTRIWITLNSMWKTLFKWKSYRN